MNNIEQQNCPHCNHILDGVGSFDPNEQCNPVEGDLTLCINCGAVLVFNSVLKVERITDDTWQEIIINKPILLDVIIKAKSLIKKRLHE